MDFIYDDKFIIPFLSALFATLGASLTILLLQWLFEFKKDKNNKLYAVAYIADVCSRLVSMNLLLKKRTIQPHIDATNNIIDGDKELLKTMFQSGDFDILNDKPFDFNLLPESHKVLLGINDMNLIQSFEIIINMNLNVKTSNDLNIFVKNNLKSEQLFEGYGKEKQEEILNTYLDYLDRITHESNRMVSFILEKMIPSIKKYINGNQFKFFSKKSIEKDFENIERTKTMFKDVLPEKGYLEKKVYDGIQKAL